MIHCLHQRKIVSDIDNTGHERGRQRQIEDETYLIIPREGAFEDIESDRSSIQDCHMPVWSPPFLDQKRQNAFPHEVED